MGGVNWHGQIKRSTTWNRFGMKVFISYRRSDTEYIAGRIYDRLVSALGKDQVFKDVDSIPTVPIFVTRWISISQIAILS